MDLASTSSEQEVGRDGVDASENGAMFVQADAEFHKSTNTHHITLTTPIESDFVRDVEPEGCPDARVCVCRVTMTRNPEGVTRTQLGGSIAETTIIQAQSFKCVVVTDGKRILTACSVRSAD